MKRQPPGTNQLAIFILLFLFGLQSIQLAGQTEMYKTHQNAVVTDAHAHGLSFGSSNSQLDLAMIEQGGIDVIGLYFAYYPLNNSTLIATVNNDMAKLRKQIDTGNYHLGIAADTRQLKEIVDQGKIAILPGTEYFYGIFQNHVSTVDSLYASGIRAITLMDNDFDILSIERQEEDSTATLNDFGKRIIDRMNQLGILIDISHLNDAMQRAVIGYSSSPVIASHSPVRGIHDVMRNIPDDILLQLKAKNGAIMVTFNSGSLAGIKEGRANIDHLIDHIMHAISIVGIDHVGIGSDFNGGGIRSPEGLEDASGFPIITHKLIESGLSEGDINKIMGLNYLRLFGKVEELSPD